MIYLQKVENNPPVRYNEVKKYSYMFPGFSKKTGHFTQVVWKDTTKVGMALAKDSEKAFICANYAPQVVPYLL